VGARRDVTHLRKTLVGDTLPIYRQHISDKTKEN
jgi:hypothetical protein